MSLRLTHEAVEGAYNFLRACYPFCRWNLPEADDLAFKVTRHNDRFAHFEYNTGAFPNVAVSERHVKTLDDLLAAMGHELIHIHQWKRGTGSKRGQHNKEFRRLAKLVCKELGFDIKTF